VVVRLSFRWGTTGLSEMLRRDRPLIDPETQGALVAILLVAMAVGAMVVVFVGVHP